MSPDPSLAANPFAALSLIAAPAILTNACALLALSTSNRFIRAADRMRTLADRLDRGVDSDATLALLRTQVHRGEKQAVLLLHGLGGIYVGLASFAGASLVSIVGTASAGAGWHPFAHAAVIVALAAGFVGAGGIVVSCFNLFRATRLTMLNITDEAALIRQREANRQRDPR